MTRGKLVRWVRVLPGRGGVQPRAKQYHRDEKAQERARHFLPGRNLLEKHFNPPAAALAATSGNNGTLIDEKLCTLEQSLRRARAPRPYVSAFFASGREACSGDKCRGWRES